MWQEKPKDETKINNIKKQNGLIFEYIRLLKNYGNKVRLLIIMYVGIL